MDLVFKVKELGRLPVVTFAAGGIATPADVMLTMELGCDGVFVGSGIFKVLIIIFRAVNQKKEQKLLLMHVHFTKIQRKLLKSVKT